MKRLYSIVGMVSIALLLVMATVNANADSFTVDALANSSSSEGAGLNTAIGLSVGQMFTVSVGQSDLWNAGPLPRWSNANGLVGNLSATGNDESGQAAGTLIGESFAFLTQHDLSAPFGSLVGELSGTYFLLGTNFSGAAPATGTLKLYYWDSNNEDNTGSLAAVVNINAVPEPATMLLFGLGLLGLAGLRRKLKK